MLIILSPSKTLDYSPSSVSLASEPVFQKQAQTLITYLRKLSATEIADLMDVSEKIAVLNRERYQNFEKKTQNKHSKQALLAFKGDVYLGFETERYTEKEYEYAQEHLRILSGLYGILKPMDWIQPYRLEMGTALNTPNAKNLYEFWGDKITRSINEVLKMDSEKTLINLASQEYFAAVVPAKLRGKLITIHFKEWRADKLQVISFNAKKARGKMANFAILHHLTDPEALKYCREDGYVYNPEYSDSENWVFIKQKYP